MRIVLLGSRGQLGQALQRSLHGLGDVLALTHQQLDLTAPQQIEKTMQALQPNWIVNAAAYTAVDQAEAEPRLADCVNHQALRHLSDYAHRHGAWLLHYSTDYVFDGAQAPPYAYAETDVARPISVYGATKYAGEQAIQKTDCAYIILRTSWLFAAQGKNFLTSLLTRAQNQKQAQVQEPLRIVCDQWGSPTSVNWLAQCTAQLMQHVCTLERQQGQAAAHAVRGLYHLSAAGVTSWFEYAQYILQRAVLLDLPVQVCAEQLVPISRADYPHVATRPMNTQLCSNKACQVFNLTQTDWRVQLDAVLHVIQMNRGAHESDAC